MPARVEVKPTQDAWNTYGDLEDKLILEANDSPFKLIALPVFQRLAFSMLKMSMLIAITRREPKDNNVISLEASDIVQAASYIQKWGKYSIDLMSNAGKTDLEKDLDRFMRSVTEHPGLQRQEIMRRWRFSARQMRDLTDTLEMRGLIKVAQKGREQRIYPIE
jgi:hypothetical protein